MTTLLVSVSFALAPLFHREDLVAPRCVAITMCFVCGLLNAAFQHMGSHCYLFHTFVNLMIVMLICIGIYTLLMKIRALWCPHVRLGPAKTAQHPEDTNQSGPSSLDDDMADRVEKADAFRHALSEALADGTYEAKYGEPSVSTGSLEQAEEEDLSDDGFGRWDEHFEMAAFMEDGLSRLVAQQDVGDDLPPPPPQLALTQTSAEVVNRTFDIARADSPPSPPQEGKLWTSSKVKMNRASRLRIRNGGAASNGNRKGGGSPKGGERILLLW